MNRRHFVGGLTVLLLLLLLLSGFCIWATRGLTGEIGTLITRNYDNIHAVHELRSALTRISVQTPAPGDGPGLPDAPVTLRHQRGIVEAKLRQLLRHADPPAERQMVLRLQAACADYFRASALRPRDPERLAKLTASVGGLTTEIQAVADQLVELNETAMLARRDAALARGRRVTIIATGFAVFSLGLYVFASLRMTRAVFEPLRRLRDSIQQVRARRFDMVVPIEGGDELGQIAASFNQMARELHRYVSESDERAVRVSRINRAILEALPHPVYIVDRNLAVHLTNPRADQLSRALGIPGAIPGEVRRITDAAAARGTDAVGDDIRRALRFPSDGGEGGGRSHTDYLPQVFQMPAAFDGEHGWAVLLVDVTELRRMDEAKTRTLTMLGHEVKAPVVGIGMTLQLLLEGKFGALADPQRELVEAGLGDCQRLLAVLRTLLELAQFESGRVELALSAYAPADLLAEAGAVHADAAQRAGSELRIAAGPDLPPVLAEPVHALRVLGNFLSNAIKYGVPGSPILLRGERRGDGFVRFAVANHTRRRLTEQEQARVFEPFFRRPSESAEGTGLGLTISREIAATLGGRVGVFCPAEAERVEFYFDLRIADPAAAAAAGPAAAPARRDAGPLAGR